MRYSQLFGKTRYNEQGGSDFISHQYLVRGGFIAESTAGRYFFLPLGWRVHEKIRAIIKEEMDKAGAQEMISPTLHPLELWKETNRTSTVGFELMTIKDRRGSEFALGGTAEEMFVDVVRKFNLSYKDLPFNIYQFSTKFRDEMRARGGLLRVREFVMKDAYSFSTSAAQFKIEYDKMAATYKTIFSKLGLDALMVAADNGYIGGEYCHEFQVETEIGEGKFFVSADGKYVAHEDIANFLREEKNTSEPIQELQEVTAPRGKTMQDGVELHKLPLWQQLKNVLYANEKDELILAVIRGDLEVNETKLAKAVQAAQIRPATAAEIANLGTVAGFISPVNLPHKPKWLVADTSVRTVHNFYSGANKTNLDYFNINIDRDFTADIETDIALAKSGYLSEDTQSPLTEKRGVEVGNIFQLGYHYSNKMQKAVFTDDKGQKQPYYMGCYGIGLGRTLATVVEKHHDDKGITWPKSIAPFSAHLISLGDVQERAAQIYHELQAANIDVLWDDRTTSAGTKFMDADLIGIPYRLVISPKTGDKVEVKLRTEAESSLLSLIDLISLIKS